MNLEVYDELNHAKARLTRAKAELAEMKIARERGELIPIEDVHAQWAENAANVRKKILALEGKLPVMLSGKSLSDMAAIIHEAVYEALNELGGYKANGGCDSGA